MPQLFLLDGHCAAYVNTEAFTNTATFLNVMSIGLAPVHCIWSISHFAIASAHLTAHSTWSCPP